MGKIFPEREKHASYPAGILYFGVKRRTILVGKAEQMPIRNFDEWEQAVLDKRMSKLREEIEADIPPARTTKRPLTPLQFRFRKLAKLAVLFATGGGLLLILVNRFPERLEPVISFLEKFYVGLLRR
jgi:hypothetical protein